MDDPRKKKDYNPQKQCGQMYDTNDSLNDYVFEILFIVCYCKN